MESYSTNVGRFATVNLERSADKPDFDKIVDTLANDEKHCMDFVKACLVKVGLQVSEQHHVPSLSRIHLSSLEPADIPELMKSLQKSVTEENGEEYIKGENDTLHLINPSTWKMSNLKDALAGNDQTGQFGDTADDATVDYNAVVKEVLVHKKDYPPSKETPYFNHYAFYANLRDYNTKEKKAAVDVEFGSHLLYGEVVTSTNTILEKYSALSPSVRYLLTLLQKSLSSPAPPSRPRLYRHSASGRPWPRLQYLGLACRIPHVLRSDSPPHVSPHLRARCIYPIPRRHGCGPRHQVLRRNQIQRRPHKTEMAQRHLCTRSHLGRKGRSEESVYQDRWNSREFAL